jgi:hypothetical protein
MTTLTIGQPAIDPDPFHRYRWQGRDLPSWSTIRDIAGVKRKVHTWALERMVEEAMRWGPTILAATQTANPAAEALVRRKLLEAAEEERMTAARLGTRIHEAVEHGMAPEDAPSDIAQRLLVFRSFLVRSGAQVLGQEYQVYNLTVGYGGTVDLLLLLPDGRIWVVDIKTGRSVWGEHALQLEGYRQGEFVGRDDIVDEAMTAFHRSAFGTAVLHLTDEHADFLALTPDPEAWPAFLGLHRFASWLHDHDRIEEVTMAKRRIKP